MDHVQELAAAIAALDPAQRRRLFQLLDEQKNTPGQERSQASLPIPATFSSAQSPDYGLTFDGGSKGNPGWGYGSYAITRVQDGAQRLERLDLGDGYTNNEAEYDTLIAALQDLIGRIQEAGRDPEEFSLEVRGDSLLAINQIKGEWKAKEPRMRARRDQCRRLLARFGQVKLVAHPREESVRILGH